jgi:hypothetical protein
MSGDPSDDQGLGTSNERQEATAGGSLQPASTETSSPSVLASISEVTLEAIYSAIYLGMAPYESMLLSMLTDEQMEALDADPVFNRRVLFYQQKRVRDVLTSTDDAMTRNLRIGITTEARWLLSKLDRKRFGNGPGEVADSGDLPPVSYSKRGK